MTFQFLQLCIINFIKGGRGRGLAELILTLPTLSHAYLFVELLINSKLEVIEG